MAVDDSYTKSLLHFNGADTSQTFTDESGKTWTANGNSQLDTAQKKFGSASALFDGTNDYLSTPAHADWNWGTDPWTIDFWIRPNTLANNVGIFDNSLQAAPNKFAVTTINTGDKVLRLHFAGTVYPGTVVLSDGDWHHIAVVRNGTSLRLYINGTADIDETISASDSWDGSSTAFWIAGYYITGNYNFNGWIDEFRISKGVARWFANFTPPVFEYGTALTSNIIISPSISGTILNGLPGDIRGSISIPILVGGSLLYEKAREPGYGDVLFPGFTADGEGWDTLHGVGSFEFPIFTFDASGIISPIGIGNVVMPAMSVSSNGNVSLIGTASISMPNFTIDTATLTSINGNASISFPAFTLDITAIPGVKGTFDQSFPAFTLSANSAVNMTGIGSITFPGFTLFTYSVFTADYLSMVMNIKNKALTLYDNYDFNSFCRFGTKHLGAIATAIYDLDSGTTDAGTSISWNFQTGYIDLEQKQKKKLQQAWISYKSTGDLILTVIQPDGSQYEYDLKIVDTTENGIRVKFGKGIKSKYVALDIKSVDGSNITLDSIKLQFEKLAKVR